MRPLMGEKEMGEQPNPKADVVVPVVRVVVVADRAGSVLAVIVERAATHHMTGSPTAERAAMPHYSGAGYTATLSFDSDRAVAPDCRSQPPNSRPTSSTMRQTCSY